MCAFFSLIEYICQSSGPFYARGRFICCGLLYQMRQDSIHRNLRRFFCGVNQNIQTLRPKGLRFSCKWYEKLQFGGQCILIIRMVSKNMTGIWNELTHSKCVNLEIAAISRMFCQQAYVLPLDSADCEFELENPSTISKRLACTKLYRVYCYNIMHNNLHSSDVSMPSEIPSIRMQKQYA